MKRLHTHYDNLKVARNAPPEVIRAVFAATRKIDQSTLPEMELLLLEKP